MSYYTYRIRIVDAQQVQVEKRDEQGKLLQEPNGRLKYEEHRQQLDDLCTAAFKNELEGTAVVELGELLFSTLFDDKLRQNFVDFYNSVVRNEGKLLRIELDVNEHSLPHIAALPWEFMRLPTGANLGALWLATGPNLIFSRRRPQWYVPPPIQLASKEKLRIALAVSAPHGLGPVEHKTVWQGLERLVEQMPDKIELLPLVGKATPKSIDNSLRAKPHIFHFIGHARQHDEIGQPVGQIALIDDLFDDPIWCGAERFSELFTRHWPGVVLLQACEGAALSAAQAFVGVASRVVQQNIPVVVAMQYEVSNSTAVRFALDFYERLAQFEPVDQAAQEGRRSITLGPVGYNKRDFATPVIFMSVRDGHLFVSSETNVVPVEESKPTMTEAPATLSLPQVAALGRLISANFSADELRDLAAFLGIDYDDLSGGSKAAKARSLADHCRRHGKVPDLWAELHQEREHINWREVL
jgi:hypothetical protein